jgi:4-diphosphocytidyl-2-C-methyl-D-erythritol kinase
MRARHPDLPPVAYALRKAIPAQAGLGGGSADAAAVLVGLNEWGGLGHSRAALALLAAELGSDTSFAVLGGCAVGRGRGERLTPLPWRLEAHVLLARPDLGVSTAAAYAACIPSGPAGADLAAMTEALLAGDLPGVRARLTNDFETDRLPGANLLREVKERLVFAGAVAPLLCGSGSALFALFDRADEAAAARAALLADGGPPLWTALARVGPYSPSVLDFER